MNFKILILVISSVVAIDGLHAQNVKLEKSKLEPSSVAMSFEKMQGEAVVKVVFDTTTKGVDQPTLVKIKGNDFTNGIVEVKVLSRIMKNAPESSRGFIGLAFRINEQNSKFESIYIRPTNGRAKDQLRRNHSIQYFSYPGFDFEESRKVAPGIYESYADMGLDEWITMRIEISGNHAELFLNNIKQPSLIVNDLKLGESASGAVGLWVGNYTEGYFKDLKIWKK